MPHIPLPFVHPARGKANSASVSDARAKKRNPTLRRAAGEQRGAPVRHDFEALCQHEREDRGYERRVFSDGHQHIRLRRAAPVAAQLPAPRGAHAKGASLLAQLRRGATCCATAQTAREGLTRHASSHQPKCAASSTRTVSSCDRVHPTPARAAARLSASAGLPAARSAAARPRSMPTARTAPEVTGAGERGGAEPALAVASLVPELLSRATQQGAAALSAGRAGDAVKHFSEAVELAQAAATPPVLSELLARRSAAQLAAGDPERALEDSLAAVQQAATSEVRARSSVSRAAQSTPCDARSRHSRAGSAEHGVRARRTARPHQRAPILHGLVETRGGRVRAQRYGKTTPVGTRR